MRRIITIAIIAMLASPAAAQTRHPWSGYGARDIRELRNESATRRERLKDLARKQNEKRPDVREPSRIGAHRPPSRVPVLSSPKPTPRPAPRPEKLMGPYAAVWPGPVLPLTSEERSSYVRGMPETSINPFRANGSLSSPAAVGAKNPRGGLRAEVSVSEQKMRLIDGARIIAEWPVSTGRRGYESTRGEFSVNFLSRNHRSSIYGNSPMPCSIFYNGGEAIHGTKQTGSLGRKASHGCVRLETRNACALYDMVAERGKGSLRVIVTE